VTDVHQHIAYVHKAVILKLTAVGNFFGVKCLNHLLED